MVTAAWELRISEKSRISVSFLVVDARYRVGSKIFNNCVLLPWNICCFCKTFRQTGHFHFDNLCKRARRNYAASLDFLKLHSLSVGVFFGSAFAVHVTGVTKLFLVIASETILLHLNSRVSTNSLYYCWRTSGIQSTKARSFSPNAMSGPTLTHESFKKGLIRSNLPTTVA